MKLRISHVIVQPVLVWDDGEELTPGPDLSQMAVPVSQLSRIAESLPGEVSLMQAKLEEEQSQLLDGQPSN